MRAIKTKKCTKTRYKVLEKNGMNIHKFKKEFLMGRTKIASYDIVIDKTDDMLWLVSKDGKKWIPTFEKLIK